MGLERRGGGVYYYASRRAGRRVLKEYVAAGLEAEQAARKAAAERSRRRLSRSRQQEQLAEAAAEWQEVEDSQSAADQVVAAALAAHGWHRVRRQWRRKRGTAMGATQAAGWNLADLLKAAGHLPPGVAERAKAGDQQALAEVDAYLARPAARALYGDLGRHVLTKWATLYGGSDPVLRRGVLRHAADLRERLAGPAPTALEELVAERVVLAWLAVSWCEYQLISLMSELDAAALEAHGRRVERAHRMLLAACRTLAKVRQANLSSVLAMVSETPPGVGTHTRQRTKRPAGHTPANKGWRRPVTK